MSSRGLQRLDTDECLELLRGHTLGRVGARVADEPLVLPVRYVIVGDEIVFRTDPGAKLIAAVLGTRVAFEVDDGATWNVLVVGHAREVRESSVDAQDARERLDAYWPTGERERLVGIAIEKISGRRLVASDG